MDKDRKSDRNEFSEERALVINRDSLDGLTLHDIDNFLKSTRNAAASERYRQARLWILELIVDNKLDEIHQIRRIGSKEIANRLVPLGVRFRPSEDERYSLDKEKRIWFDLLKAEHARRDRNADRSEGALKNDADSLTYLRWIANNKLSPKERIVLITGDSLVFDVYRAWYVDQPSGEPFVLRRASQYVPLINLNDTPNEIINRRELFLWTREAVEAALFVFNLSGSGKNIEELHKGREHLALSLSYYREADKATPLTAFFKRITTEWLDERKENFRRLVYLWQQMERFVIGINYDLIRRRYKSYERNIAREAITTGGDAYIAYLKEILDELVSGSIRLFFPFAAEFIRSIFSGAREKVGWTSRVPTVVRLFVPKQGDIHALRYKETGGYDVHEILELWHRGDKTATTLLDVNINKTLSMRPDLVYSIATVLALEAGEWMEAERFSDLARCASPLVKMDDMEKESTHLEAMYLYALSKRFRIGSIDPRRSVARRDVWRDLLESAVDSLNKCEQAHDLRGELRRQLRAVSERAAVRLFYVAWPIVTTGDSGRSYRVDMGGVQRELELALNDLRKCMMIDTKVEGSPGEDIQRQRFVERVRRQYVTNFAALQILSRLLHRKGVVQGDVAVLTKGEVGIVAARSVDWISRDSATAISRAALGDLLAFRALELGDEVAGARLLDVMKEHRMADLPIDGAIFDALVGVVKEIPRRV